MQKARTLAVCVAFVLCAKTGHADSIILNGNFENNSASATIFNMTNAVFNATVADATSFARVGEIDLVTGTDFGIAPISGSWKLGLHTSGPDFPGQFDAFSFDLSTAVTTGTSYNLQFFGALLGFPEVGAGTINIGLSNSATDFGRLIFTGSPSSSASWAQFNSAFVAPIDASFLTVRLGLNREQYAFVDNFSLETSPNVVPEPGSLLLLGTGLAAACRLRRRLRKGSPPSSRKTIAASVSSNFSRC